MTHKIELVKNVTINPFFDFTDENSYKGQPCRILKNKLGLELCQVGFRLCVLSFSTSKILSLCDVWMKSAKFLMNST